MSTELLEKIIQSSGICCHCGLSWAELKCKTRLHPGKPVSNSIKKIIRAQENESRLSRYRKTILRKSLRRQNNKLFIKCLVCSRNTIILQKKPKKDKSKHFESMKVESTPSNRSCQKKKKQKRYKDPKVGLNISIPNSKITTPSQTSNSASCSGSFTPMLQRRKKMANLQTPLQKLKLMNKDKLKNLLNNDGMKERKRRKLSDFLKEIY